MLTIQILSYNKSLYAANAVRSIALNPPSIPYQIMVYEGSSNTDNISVFHDIWRAEFEPLPLRYTCGPNYGFGKAYNYMGEHMDEKTTHVICMNEDMFFGPGALDVLIEYAHRGLSCCNLTNGGLYERLNPKASDVIDFADRNKTSPKTISLGSNPPFCFTIENWTKLSCTDVWSTPPLEGNKFRGPFDEQIDPSCIGWFCDWCLFNRVHLLGLECIICDGAPGYHYDHVSGSVMDRENPGWTNYAERNYGVKYGIGITKLVDFLNANPGHRFLCGLPRPDYYPIPCSESWRKA